MDNGYRIPSRREARQKRAQEERGKLFELHRTGGYAHVREMNAADLALAEGLPAELQAAVLAVFQDNASNARQAPSQISWDRIRKNVAQQRQLADAACIAGFLRPRLVMTPAEADAANDDNVWCVEDLHPEERIRFLNLVIGQDKEAAEKLIPFPETGVGSVGALPTGAASPTSVVVAFPAASGV